MLLLDLNNIIVGVGFLLFDAARAGEVNCSLDTRVVLNGGLSFEATLGLDAVFGLDSGLILDRRRTLDAGILLDVRFPCYTS